MRCGVLRRFQATSSSTVYPYKNATENRVSPCRTRCVSGFLRGRSLRSPTGALTGRELQAAKKQIRISHALRSTVLSSKSQIGNDPQTDQYPTNPFDIQAQTIFHRTTPPGQQAGDQEKPRTAPHRRSHKKWRK